jgi:ABC-type Fe3+ transport system substrate-binding protein
MSFWKIAACLSLAVGIGITFVSARAAHAETVAELYEKAKAEKTLVLFGSGQAEAYERWTKEFEKTFPGITVSFTGGFSNVFNKEINKQLAEKNLQVDMVTLQTVQDFTAWKKQGALLNFKYDGYDQIMPAYREPDGAFSVIQLNAMSYGYNTDLLKPEDVPRSALDFLKPQFKGRVSSTYPHDDDSTLFLYELLVEKYGWKFVTDFVETQPKFVQGHLGVSRSLASAEALVSFDVTGSASTLKRAGQPIELAYSQADLTPVSTLVIGIFKDAPHANAAKLYVTWYLAKEQQSRTNSYSVRADVAAPSGLPDLKSLKIADNYMQFLSDEERLVPVRAKYQKLIGPVINAGGVR